MMVISQGKRIYFELHGEDVNCQDNRQNSGYGHS
jgi:hypothetical protein